MLVTLVVTVIAVFLQDVKPGMSGYLTVAYTALASHCGLHHVISNLIAIKDTGIKH